MPDYAKTKQSVSITKTYRAALYIRLSKEDGDKVESDSVVNQKKILTGFVNSQPDIELRAYYVDDGWSGASFDRPDFIRMMSDVYSGQVNCVIVKDSSRFGRNASESGRYIGEIFPKLGVRYIAVNDAIDSGRSQGVAIDFLNNTMRGMINEYYVAANSESIRSTLDMERKRGSFIGAFAKYGYKKDPNDHHKLIVDEVAARTVRMIFTLYLKGNGIRSIVRYLNENGIPNPSAYKQQQGFHYHSRAIGKSALWSDKTVRRTLADEMYIGNMVQGKFRKISYKDKAIRACDEIDWIRVAGTHEAIISPDDFERVQRMLKKGAKTSPATGRIDLFSGLLKCADCGHALIKKTNRNPDKTYIYYRCSIHCKCSNACSTHTIRYEKLYQAVLGSIQMMIALAVNADDVIRKMKLRKDNSHFEMNKLQLQSQEEKLQKLIGQMSDLYPDYKSGILNKDQYITNKDRYEKQIEELKHNISALKASVQNGEITDKQNGFIEHFKRYGNISELTRPLLIELVEQIAVHEGGTLDITFRFQDELKNVQHLIGNQSA
ncbi:recombinase family protein [Ruminococcus sp.]|uniref:recombinase family protein n=1 Tax=Ruminococcus sp. TaxID=41978 RepID=UPI00389005E8